jgi:hypothetical protein
MRSLLVVFAILGLAGCKPAQVTLILDPGFYPSAVAHDPINDRFFVGSHATGAIAIVRRDGHSVATVRPEEASRPIVQLAYEPRVRRLWALTPNAVEVVDVAALPVRRTLIGGAEPGGQFTDIVTDGGGRAYVLDAANGQVVAAEPGRRALRLIASLPDAPAPEPPLAGGALALLPGGSVLLAARGADLWRIDLATGAVEAVALAGGLTEVSQLLLLGSDGTAHHVAAFRGRANEIVTLRLAADGRRASVDGGTRMRYDTPVHGAFDGREVVVLLGRLRHHPSFGGDGRPNLPPRLATYFAGGAAGPRLAAAPPAAVPALVR